MVTNLSTELGRPRQLKAKRVISMPLFVHPNQTIMLPDALLAVVVCRHTDKESYQEAQDIKRVREAKFMRRQINHNIRWKIARPDMMRQKEPLMSQRQSDYMSS